MYYPYLRGKQFELLVVRENAVWFDRTIVPIIEPVQRSVVGLKRALKAMIDQAVRFIVVGNPRVGSVNRQDLLQEVFGEQLQVYENWSLGIITDAQTTEAEITDTARLHNDITIIHYGHQDPERLSQALISIAGITSHVFIDGNTGRLYRDQFPGGTRILLRDGFEIRTNRNHPAEEPFSELHLTYQADGFDGFGDFLMVGDEFSERGGAAQTVAIHYTEIDPNRKNIMVIKHFLSDDRDGVTNPGGKFAQAVAHLAQYLNTRPGAYFRSDGAQNFLRLHLSGHYPGLGFVKKISIQHHMEMIRHFLES